MPMPHPSEFPPQIQARAQKIRLLILDVDGVLTDGGLYFDASGALLKRFHVHDGLGMKMAMEVGLRLAVITGLKSPAVQARIRELGVHHYYEGHHRKTPLVRRIAAEEGIGLEHIAYLGDDLVDLAPLRVVGLPLAVPNGRPEVLEQACWVTPHPGGHGAVRDAIEAILRAQGLWEDVCVRWTSE